MKNIKDRLLALGLGAFSVISLGAVGTCTGPQEVSQRVETPAFDAEPVPSPTPLSRTRKALQAELIETQQLWAELQRNPKARDNWAADWNVRVREVRDRLGEPGVPGSPKCAKTRPCVAAFYLNFALADMQVYFRLGGDENLKKDIEQSLGNAKAILK